MNWIVLIVALTALAFWLIAKSEKAKNQWVDDEYARMNQKYSLKFFEMVDGELIKEAIIATLKDDSYCRNYSEKEVNPSMMRFAHHIHLKGTAIMGERISDVFGVMEKTAEKQPKRRIGTKYAKRRKK